MECSLQCSQCTGKFTFEGKDAECITEHWDYAVVTHRAVLETAETFLSDQSGKKYQKPTIRTQDGQFIQQLFSKKAFDWLQQSITIRNNIFYNSQLNNDFRCRTWLTVLFVREVAGISFRTTESFVGTDPSDKHLAFARLWF